MSVVGVVDVGVRVYLDGFQFVWFIGVGMYATGIAPYYVLTRHSLAFYVKRSLHVPLLCLYAAVP